MQKTLNDTKTYDIAVIGAGVFGAWTAWHLAKRGKRVVLIEAYGPAHARASSGANRASFEWAMARMSCTRCGRKAHSRNGRIFCGIAATALAATGVLGWEAAMTRS